MTQTAFVLAAVCAVALAVTDDNKCGTQCTVNSECNSSGRCQFCVLGQCGSGCGQDCSEASDCLDSNCPACGADNKCASGNTPNGTVPCGGECSVNTDCNQGSNCKLCVMGKCGAGCQQPCSKSSDCQDPNCLACSDGLCQAGGSGGNGTCGATCSVNLDCAQTDNNCVLCILGKCGSGCQSGCVKDTDCGDPNCPKCTNNECQAGGGGGGNQTCGGSCVVNTDCNQGGDCPLCMEGKTCGAGCGMKCTADSQCLDTNCQHCTNGKCSGGGGGGGNQTCGGDCTVNTDCDQSGVCVLCMSGKCAAGCGQPCEESSDCGDPNCQSCKLPPDASTTVCLGGTNGGNATCGDTCIVDSDCSVSPQNCGHCMTGKCGNGCGQFCEKASDCLDSNCPACNSGKCGAAAPSPAPSTVVP